MCIHRLPLWPSCHPTLEVVTGRRAELPVLHVGSHRLPVSHVVGYICQLYLLSLPQSPLPARVRMPTLCTHTSLPALKMSSPAPFSRFHAVSAMLSPFHCVQLFVTLWIVAHQSPLSVGFPRQEYWSGLPHPPPRDLLNPAIKPVSSVSVHVCTKDPVLFLCILCIFCCVYVPQLLHPSIC